MSTKTWCMIPSWWVKSNCIFLYNNCLHRSLDYLVLILAQWTLCYILQINKEDEKGFNLVFRSYTPNLAPFGVAIVKYV